jgi:hypothetical protein
MLFQRVRRYEEQFAGFFDSTNDRGLAFICGVANYLVSGGSRVARESSTDSATVSTGTRVPLKTGAPPRISGSIVMSSLAFIVAV